MTKEEKEILFKDLSARIPYHVYVKVWLKDGTTEEGPLDLKHNYADVLRSAFYYNKIVDIKPYLRPMSSMTRQECTQLNVLLPRYFIVTPERITCLEHINGGIINFEVLDIIIDFYNSHHLDWRGLIPKCLALEAPKDMYNIK